MLFRKVVIADGQRGILTRGGRFAGILGPGVHRVHRWRRDLRIEILNVARSEFPHERYVLIEAADPRAAADNFRVVTTGPDEVALISFDGVPSSTAVGPLQCRVFWSAATRVDVRLINVTESDGRIAEDDIAAVARVSPQGLATFVDVQDHEVGLLYRNGKLDGVLEAGRHAFWMTRWAIRIVKIDLRPQLLEVTAQELLTKDRIQIRVTLSGFHRVTNPIKAAGATTDMSATLYRLVQFAIREAVSGRTLDEVLGARDRIDEEVRAYLVARTDELGVVVDAVGVKDMILPGEIRDLVNKVVDAERTARANLIRRQEETAATRSLLNTARLMDENPTLMRLKELETLERLVEKIGKVDLHASDGSGLEAMLRNLIRPASASGAPSGSSGPSAA